MLREIDGRVFEKKADGECSIAQNLVCFVFQGTIEKVEKVLSIGSNSSLHAVDNLSNTTDGGGTVVQRTVLFLMNIPVNTQNRKRIMKNHIHSISRSEVKRYQKPEQSRCHRQWQVLKQGHQQTK
jgi:hypothetical protein